MSNNLYDVDKYFVLKLYCKCAQILFMNYMGRM